MSSRYSQIASSLALGWMLENSAWLNEVNGELISTSAEPTRGFIRYRAKSITRQRRVATPPPRCTIGEPPEKKRMAVGGGTVRRWRSFSAACGRNIPDISFDKVALIAVNPFGPGCG